MKPLFREIATSLLEGRPVVLCSVIASSGSTPRGAGAKMMVDGNGKTFGTVGGGAVEHEAIKMAMDVHQSGLCKAKSFILAPNEVADLGMICGGDVRLFFQYFAATDKKAMDLFNHILALCDRKVNAWLITELQEDKPWNMGVYDEESGLQFAERIHQTDLVPHLRSRLILVKGEVPCVIEPFIRNESVFIFGGGHVSQELVPVLTKVGFRTVVFEDREQYADQKLFHGMAETILGDFQNIFRSITITDADYVVIMTRGHQSDFEIIMQVLGTKATYIGCIGSRSKREATRQKVLNLGYTDKDFSRIHTPIGLDINAETPAEIAVSIAAEMILHRAGGLKYRN